LGITQSHYLAGRRQNKSTEDVGPGPVPHGRRPSVLRRVQPRPGMEEGKQMTDAISNVVSHYLIIFPLFMSLWR
jgi:hypothetical protein